MEYEKEQLRKEISKNEWLRCEKWQYGRQGFFVGLSFVACNSIDYIAIVCAFARAKSSFNTFKEKSCASHAAI